MYEIIAKQQRKLFHDSFAETGQRDWVMINCNHQKCRPYKAIKCKFQPPCPKWETFEQCPSDTGKGELLSSLCSLQLESGSHCETFMLFVLFCACFYTSKKTWEFEKKTNWTYTGYCAPGLTLLILAKKRRARPNV